MKATILNLSFFLLSSFGYAQTQSHSTLDNVHDTLNKVQNDLIQNVFSELPNGSQLALAIIENGQSKFFGLHKNHDSILLIKNQDRIFEIGSITKVFTSTLLADFVTDDRVSLTDNISDYLKFPLHNQAEITFEQLATHTSGLPRIPPILALASLENPYKDYTEDVLVNYLRKELILNNKPGMVCEYSNLGAAVLGYVLSVIDQHSFEEMLQNKIFTRYDMQHSTIERSNAGDKLLRGINDQGEIVANWDLAAFAGAGAILSSVEDLSKFAMAQLDSSNVELKSTRQSYFEVNDTYSMGLGWSLITTDTGSIWNWHNGGTGGYTSSMIIDTKTQNGVIVLSNITALGKLSAKILNLSPELMKTLY